MTVWLLSVAAMTAAAPGDAVAAKQSAGSRETASAGAAARPAAASRVTASAAEAEPAVEAELAADSGVPWSSKLFLGKLGAGTLKVRKEFLVPPNTTLVPFHRGRIRVGEVLENTCDLVIQEEKIQPQAIRFAKERGIRLRGTYQHNAFPSSYMVTLDAEDDLIEGVRCIASGYTWMTIGFFEKHLGKTFEFIPDPPKESVPPTGK